MIAALGTLVFIHKRQRLRSHQALRDYYFEQMELSDVHTTHTISFTVVDAGYLPRPAFFYSFRWSIAALHNAAADGRLRIKEQ